jgi:hypothetical protein
MVTFPTLSIFLLISSTYFQILSTGTKCTTPLIKVSTLGCSWAIDEVQEMKTDAFPLARAIPTQNWQTWALPFRQFP